MHLRFKNTCRVCGSKNLKPVINLGEQYLQGSFIKEGYLTPPLRKVPTVLVRCDVTENENGCGLLQLQHSTPPEILYANYWYRSATNQTMRNHLKDIVDCGLEIIKEPSKSRVLDIGCNDGTLLKNYPKKMELWGFDPSDIAQEISDWVNIVGTIFPSAQGKAKLGSNKFDIVTSIAMFYDLESPIDFANSIQEILTNKGIWILEMSYMPLMLKMNSFDTVCHEHLEYYSLQVINTIMKAAGLRVFKVSLNAINGGSIRCYVCHEHCLEYDTRENHDEIRCLQLMEFGMELDTNKPYNAFQERIERLRVELDELMADIRDQGKTIHIYGASTKGNVLLQWYGIDAFKIQYASDRNEQKDGATTLGTNIKIISEEKSRQMKPDYYLVLPWHFKSEFLKRERKIIEAGTKMIFPLPELNVIDSANIDEHICAPDLSNGSLYKILGI